jgi:hypothetical protein
MQLNFLLDHCPLERPKYLTVFLSFGSWSIVLLPISFQSLVIQLTN